MDVVAFFWVMDENNREVNWSGQAANGRLSPFWGALQVGHRKLAGRVVDGLATHHTYARADYKPLMKGEIVETQIELWANALLVKKGHRMRFDVQPTSGRGRALLFYDPSYHDRAQNTIYTGPKYPSYLQLPVIPAARTGRPTALPLLDGSK